MSLSVIRLAAGIAAAALITLPAAQASAGPGSGGGGGSGGSGDGVIIATVTITTGGGTGGGSGCSWEQVVGEIGVPGMAGSAKFPFTDNGVVFNLWRKSCPSGETWYVFPETEPTDLLPQLLQQVKETALPDPEPTFLALDPVNNWAYVTVPVDFRAGGASWQPISVTASIGPVWATVTARPIALTFDPGDPAGDGVVSCAGDAPIADYIAEAPGECSYTYRNASSTSPYDGYHFLTTTSIEWAISWTSSTGAGGALSPYSTTASAPLAVAEVKGLVTCTGSRAEQGGC